MKAMSDLLAARSQMAMSLAFHILFAVAGMAMPLLMVLAESRWVRRRDPVALELAKRWAKGTAILFAVGAVSGTVLSFELGLLWPGFMRHAGPIIGMPFSLEGFAFFLEAIALGIYLYGWERVPPAAHAMAGVVIAVSGALSGIFVVAANAWMNTPAGFRMVNGVPTDVDPIAAMLNPAFAAQAIHMVLAAYASVGFAVAGIHAFMLRRDPENAFHRMAFVLALGLGGAAALLQPLSGDRTGKMVAATQPLKLAALEGQFETERGAPLRIGGWPDERAETTRGGLEIPRLTSVLAYGDPDAVVRGLKEWPREDRPPVAITHLAFQIMVACGVAMAAVALLGFGLAAARRRAPVAPGYLRLVVAASPLGLVALEAGWVVTEVGRQPWIVQGVMRTRDAVTPMPGLVVPFTVFTLLYLGLGLVVLALLRRQVFASPGAGRR
jgi:cytochrome d ubiquinol oxidase subunit I